jgi:hypothetical protein
MITRHIRRYPVPCGSRVVQTTAGERHIVARTLVAGHPTETEASPATRRTSSRSSASIAMLRDLVRGEQRKSPEEGP